MTIEQIWQAMEIEDPKNLAWLTRLARPQVGYPLLASFNPSSRTKALLIPVSKAVLPPRRTWPECRGLEIVSISLGSDPHFGVVLRDPTRADVFAVLAEDVADRVTSAPDAKSAVGEFLNRLHRWQKFLANDRGGLTVEQQRGLYGELATLKTHLLPSLGNLTAVKSWRAPLGSHQDFQLSSGALEIKTTVAKQPASVKITSERQLDDTGILALFLHVVVLDEREVEPSEEPGGHTLPEIVASLHSCLAAEPTASELFQDLLLDAGYLAADAPRYESRRYSLRKELTFLVRDGFPRVVEADLASGIGDVKYALALAACEPFAVPLETMLAALKRQAVTSHLDINTQN